MSSHCGGHQPPDVTRLICASLSRVEGSVMNELFAIRNALASGTSRRGVHGALLYTSGWFVFWLEGEPAAVESLAARAARDPRNEHQMTIHRSRGPATLSEAFTVVATQSSQTPAAFARRLY